MTSLIRHLPSADTLMRVSDAGPALGTDPAGTAPLAAAAGETVLVVLADVAPRGRLWGYTRFVLGSLPLRGTRGLKFSRQLGSGFDGGFGLKPSVSRQGLFLVFSDGASCDAFLRDSPLLEGYRRRSAELCLVRLRAYSSRGSWGGARLSGSCPAPADGPLAALTRASIRPSRALAFWRMAPAAQASLERAAGCRLAVGLGEAPLLRQATFSLWDSVAAMDAYARTGAHQDAIRASARGHFFSESMFVRFVVDSVSGTWKGQHHG